MAGEFSVLPRGGAREVGRACYQVDAGDKRFLVDCGLGQTSPITYPSFQGLDRKSIDCVFITHAHIDHTGGLPLLERGGFLKLDANIYATQPTASLSEVLLYDSLKLHKMGVRDEQYEQRYDSDDVANVLERFQPSSYGGGRIDDITFQFGDAGHLLGSAWIALEYQDRRIVFSGDIGGRSAHLKDVETPPKADTLFLESTYGDLDTHPSFSDARTRLYNTAMEAAKDGRPVLIPSFGVGRSQEILQIFRERLASEPEEVLQRIEIVYDGMIADSMARYHVFVNDDFMRDSIINYRLNSHDPTPLLPDSARQPTRMEDRQEIFKQEKTPIIIAPNGMLEGGFSSFYLHRMAMDVDKALILFIGYQAKGTVGRKLQDGDDDLIEVDVTAQMEAEFANGGEDGEFGFYTRTIFVPKSWIKTFKGFSGHAARNKLLEFARQVNPAQIRLIHGNPGVIKRFAQHLEQHTDADVSGAKEGEIYPVEWTGDKDPIEIDEGVMGDTPTVFDTNAVPNINKESPFDVIEEDRIRDIFQEEMERRGLIGDKAESDDLNEVKPTQ